MKPINWIKKLKAKGSKKELKVKITFVKPGGKWLTFINEITEKKGSLICKKAIGVYIQWLESK